MSEYTQFNPKKREYHLVGEREKAIVDCLFPLGMINRLIFPTKESFRNIPFRAETTGIQFKKALILRLQALHHDTKRVLKMSN